MSADDQSRASQRSDMEEQLSRLFTEGVGDKLEEMTYKPAATATGSATGNPRASGAWSTAAKGSTNASTSSGGATANAGIMANGKDFFLELRRQVASLVEKERAGG